MVETKNNERFTIPWEQMESAKYAVKQYLDGAEITNCVLKNCEYEPLKVGWFDNQLQYRTGIFVGVENNLIHVLENGRVVSVFSNGGIEIAPVLKHKEAIKLEWIKRFDNTTERALKYLSTYHGSEKPKFPHCEYVYQTDVRLFDLPTWNYNVETPKFPEINSFIWALAGKKRTAALLKAWCDIYKKYREDLRREMVVKLGLQNMRSEQVRRGEA